MTRHNTFRKVTNTMNRLLMDSSGVMSTQRFVYTVCLLGHTQAGTQAYSIKQILGQYNMQSLSEILLIIIFCSSSFGFNLQIIAICKIHLINSLSNIYVSLRVYYVIAGESCKL